MNRRYDKVVITVPFRLSVIAPTTHPQFSVAIPQPIRFSTGFSETDGQGVYEEFACIEDFKRGEAEKIHTCVVHRKPIGIHVEWR